MRRRRPGRGRLPRAARTVNTATRHIVAANQACLADIAGRWAWGAFPTGALTQQQSVASA
jgi:hypothetical protein